MANELTRKGIAFGAAVALGSTLIVGGAASAAPNVNYQDLELTVADHGESNGVLATTSEDTFGLLLSWNGDVNTQNFDDLTYDISWADADDEDGEGYGGTGSTYAYYDTYNDRVEADWQSNGCYTTDQFTAPHAGGSLTDTNSEDGSYTGFVGAWDATSAYGHDNFGALSEWGAPYVAINTCGYTPDVKTVATVQAFIDTNRDGDIDSTETHSAPVEVTFYNPEALTPVLKLENDGVLYSIYDEGGIEWEVTPAEPINDFWTESSTFSDKDYFVESYADGEQIHERPVQFYWDVDENDDPILYDSGLINYDVTDGVGGIGSSITQVRAGVYNNETGEYTYSAWQNVSIVEPSVDYTESYVIEQEYVRRSGGHTIIRSDVDSVEYVVEFWQEDETDLAIEGVDATVYMYGWDNGYNNFFDTHEDAQAWLDKYGVEIAGAEPEIQAVGNDYEVVWAVEGTSDEKGSITLDISVENPDADMYLFAQSVDYEGGNDLLDVSLNWYDTQYYLEFESGIYPDDSFTAEVGGSFDFTAYIVDQWYNAPDQELRLQWQSEDRGGWDYKYFEVNSDGSVDISLNDGAPADGEETGTYYEINELQMKDGSAWEAVNLDAANGDGVYIDWLTDQAVVDYLTAEGDDDSIEITYGDWVEGNWIFKSDAWDNAGDIYSVGDYVAVSGYVHAADGYAIGGAEVTVSGDDLWFEDDSGASFGSNSLDVRTTENGYFEVWIYAHKVGEHTVTITSGGKSTTVDFVANDNELFASTVTLSPFTGKAGTSETVTATVTDKWGNLVPNWDVNFSVAGGGYLTDDVDVSGGDSYDASIEDATVAGYGQASTMLVILSNEVGYGSTVTVTIDVIDPYGDLEDTTASDSLAAGATDHGKPAFWTKDIGNGEVKLYAKNIVGAGKIQFFHNGKEIAWINAVDALDPKLRAANGSYYLVRTVKLVSGKNVLEIKDDGQRVVRRVASK